MSKSTKKPFQFCLVDDATGVGFAFCSTRCLLIWVRGVQDPLRTHHLGYPKNQRECQHCFFCGDRTGYQGPCMVHDDEPCPKHNWSSTFAAVDTVPIVAQMLGRSLTESDLATLEEAYYDRHQKTDGPWEVAVRAVDRIREDEI